LVHVIITYTIVKYTLKIKLFDSCVNLTL